MADKYKNNSIDLETIEIKFNGGAYNALDSYVNFEIEESMDADSINCNLSFLDAADISNKIDFDGTEELTIKFSSPGGREIDMLFRIYKHVVTIDPNGGSAKIVTVYGVTPEHYTQSIIDVNQSFNGQISKFADTVFSKLKTKRKITIDETNGNVTTIVPGMTPFEAMEFLTNRSYDSNFKSSAYKFYETVDGYQFRNIEKIISEQKSKAITYIYNPTASVKNDSARIQFTINMLEIDANKDVMKKIKNGMYASESKEIDLINQKIIRHPFLVKDSFDDFEHLDEDAMSLDSKKLINESCSDINTTFWLMKNIDDPVRETNFTQIIPRRLYYLSALEQIKAKIGIPGNSDLSPGKVINLDMAEVSARQEGREQEGKITGNYLVTRVFHLVERGSYQNSVEMCKDSFRSNVRNPKKNIVSKRTARATI